MPSLPFRWLTLVFLAAISPLYSQDQPTVEHVATIPFYADHHQFGRGSMEYKSFQTVEELFFDGTPEIAPSKTFPGLFDPITYKDVLAHKNIIKEDPDPHLAMAHDAYLSRDWAEAQRLFLEYLNPGMTIKAEVYLFLGDTYFLQGDYKTAIINYFQYPDQGVNAHLKYYNIACSYSRMQEYPSGFVALTRAINHGFIDFDFIKSDTDLAPMFRSQFPFRLSELNVRGSFKEVPSTFKLSEVLPWEHDRISVELNSPSGSRQLVIISQGLMQRNVSSLIHAQIVSKPAFSRLAIYEVIGEQLRLFEVIDNRHITGPWDNYQFQEKDYAGKTFTLAKMPATTVLDLNHDGYYELLIDTFLILMDKEGEIQYETIYEMLPGSMILLQEDHYSVLYAQRYGQIGDGGDIPIFFFESLTVNDDLTITSEPSDLAFSYALNFAIHLLNNGFPFADVNHLRTMIDEVRPDRAEEIWRTTVIPKLSEDGQRSR